MRRILVAAALAALFATSPALAQSYPTGVTNERAPGHVNMQCDSAQANCQPPSSANPVPVTVVSGGGTQQVVGNVAAQATDSGNPVKIGCKYVTAGFEAITDGQRGNIQCNAISILKVQLAASNNAEPSIFSLADGLGAQQALSVAAFGYSFDSVGTAYNLNRGDKNGIVVQPGLSGTFWQYAAAASGIVSSTADVAVKAAAGASVRNFVCTIDISHDTLSAVSEIVIKDNATVIWRGKLSTTAVDAGGGAGKMIFTPCLRGSLNVAVNVAMISSVTGGVYVNLTGYTGS